MILQDTIYTADSCDYSYLQDIYRFHLPMFVPTPLHGIHLLQRPRIYTPLPFVTWSSMGLSAPNCSTATSLRHDKIAATSHDPPEVRWSQAFLSADYISVPYDLRYDRMGQPIAQPTLRQSFSCQLHGHRRRWDRNLITCPTFHW